MKPEINVYAAEWCHDSRAIEKYLTTLGLKFNYFDFEKDDKAAEIVLEANDNMSSEIPVLIIGKDVLVNPTVEDLNKVLVQYGLHDFN